MSEEIVAWCLSDNTMQPLLSADTSSSSCGRTRNTSAFSTSVKNGDGKAVNDNSFDVANDGNSCLNRAAGLSSAHRFCFQSNVLCHESNSIGDDNTSKMRKNGPSIHGQSLIAMKDNDQMLVDGMANGHARDEVGGVRPGDPEEAGDIITTCLMPGGNPYIVKRANRHPSYPIIRVSSMHVWDIMTSDGASTTHIPTPINTPTPTSSECMTTMTIRLIISYIPPPVAGKTQQCINGCSNTINSYGHDDDDGGDDDAVGRGNDAGYLMVHSDSYHCPYLYILEGNSLLVMQKIDLRRYILSATIRSFAAASGHGCMPTTTTTNTTNNNNNNNNNTHTRDTADGMRGKLARLFIKSWQASYDQQYKTDEKFSKCHDWKQQRNSGTVKTTETTVGQEEDHKQSKDSVSNEHADQLPLHVTDNDAMRKSESQNHFNTSNDQNSQGTRNAICNSENNTDNIHKAGSGSSSSKSETNVDEKEDADKHSVLVGIESGRLRDRGESFNPENNDDDVLDEENDDDEEEDEDDDDSGSNVGSLQALQQQASDDSDSDSDSSEAVSIKDMEDGEEDEEDEEEDDEDEDDDEEDDKDAAGTGDGDLDTMDMAIDVDGADNGDEHEHEGLRPDAMEICTDVAADEIATNSHQSGMGVTAVGNMDSNGANGEGGDNQPPAIPGSSSTREPTTAPKIDKSELRKSTSRGSISFLKRKGKRIPGGHKRKACRVSSGYSGVMPRLRRRMGRRRNTTKTTTKTRIISVNLIQPFSPCYTSEVTTDIYNNGINDAVHGITEALIKHKKFGSKNGMMNGYVYDCLSNGLPTMGSNVLGNAGDAAANAMNQAPIDYSMQMLVQLETVEIETISQKVNHRPHTPTTTATTTGAGAAPTAATSNAAEAMASSGNANDKEVSQSPVITCSNGTHADGIECAPTNSKSNNNNNNINSSCEHESTCKSEEHAAAEFVVKRKYRTTNSLHCIKLGIKSLHYHHLLPCHNGSYSTSSLCTGASVANESDQNVGTSYCKNGISRRMVTAMKVDADKTGKGRESEPPPSSPPPSSKSALISSPIILGQVMLQSSFNETFNNQSILREENGSTSDNNNNERSDPAAVHPCPVNLFACNSPYDLHCRENGMLLFATHAAAASVAEKRIYGRHSGIASQSSSFSPSQGTPWGSSLFVCKQSIVSSDFSGSSYPVGFTLIKKVIPYLGRWVDVTACGHSLILCRISNVLQTCVCGVSILHCHTLTMVIPCCRVYPLTTPYFTYRLYKMCMYWCVCVYRTRGRIR